MLVVLVVPFCKGVGHLLCVTMVKVFFKDNFCLLLELLLVHLWG